MKIISKKEAAKLGMSRFYTGKACCRGHVDERYVSNGACVTCHKDRVLRDRKEIIRIMKNARRELLPEVL